MFVDDEVPKLGAGIAQQYVDAQIDETVALDGSRLKRVMGHGRVSSSKLKRFNTSRKILQQSLISIQVPTQAVK